MQGEIVGPFVNRNKDLTPMQKGFVAVVEPMKTATKVQPKIIGDVTTLPKGSEVLLIRQYGFGDTLMMTPLIRAMHGRGLIVDVQTLEAYRCLFEGNPYVRDVFPMEKELDSFDYDMVLDLDAYDEPINAAEPNRIKHYARCIGLHLKAPDETKLDYYIREEELQAARNFLTRNLLTDPLPRPWIAYVWGSRSKSRNWATSTHLLVLRALLKGGSSVIALSSQPEKGVPDDRPNVLNLTGSIKGLRKLAALIGVCDGVVSPDTGTFHLAAALDRPILAYFGTFSIDERKSGAETQLTMANDPESRCHWHPCHQYDCPWASHEIESPCVYPEITRVREWVRGLVPPTPEEVVPDASAMGIVDERPNPEETDRDDNVSGGDIPRLRNRRRTASNSRSSGDSDASPEGVVSVGGSDNNEPVQVLLQQPTERSGSGDNGHITGTVSAGT